MPRLGQVLQSTARVAMQDPSTGAAEHAASAGAAMQDPSAGAAEHAASASATEHDGSAGAAEDRLAQVMLCHEDLARLRQKNMSCDEQHRQARQWLNWMASIPPHDAPFNVDIHWPGWKA